MLIRVAIFLVLLCFATDAISQSRTISVIAGHVQDESETPLSDAVVQIQSPAFIGGSRSAQTDAQGKFRFTAVPPGQYQMTIAKAGYQTIHLEKIQITAGLNAEIPIQMTLFSGNQDLIISADSKLIDPSTSAMSTVLSQDFMKNIPAERDTSHILDLAPGINLESAYGGGEESGNAYQMDGIDISDPQAGAPWSFFNYSLIDQVELVGLGAPAEYGQFTGVVFNTITKSGANQFSGETEFYYSGESLNATAADPNLSARIDQQVEGNLQFGGALKKDELWYFAGAQYLHSRISEGGPIETETDPRVFLKLTFAPIQNSTLDGWIEWDHTKITGRDGDAFTPLEATTGENNPEFVGNISWKYLLSRNSLINVGWGGYTGERHFDPHNGFLIPGHVDAQTGIASVNASQFGRLERTRSQLNASLSQHADNFISGSHEFKFGMEFEYSRVHDRYGYPGNAFFSDNEGPEEDPSTGEDDFFTLGYRGGGYDAHGTGKRVSLFAQDSWRISDRFTINPGLRMDINRGEVSNGKTVFKTHGLAPRIGIAWDLFGNGETILRTHYGRYFEALYAAYYYYMDPGAFFPQTVQRTFNRSGFSETILSNPGQQYAMDPDIKQPYMDQVILGFDQQLPRGIVFSATGIYRKNQNLIETVSRDGMFVPVKGFIPGSGQEVTLYDYLNPDSDVLIYTNPKSLQRNYKGIILSASRTFSGGWQLITSYVYSHTRGNIDNLGFDETGIGGNTPFFDGHFLDTPNSLINTEGRLTHDQTHQIKIQGTWNPVKTNFSFSTNYTYHSGDTWTPRTDCLLTDDGNGILGDGIFDCHEFPQGPVLYFAETRGSRRLPARSEIDLRAEWHYNLSDDHQIAFFIDVFNLFNQSRATEVETIEDEEFGQTAAVNLPRNARFGIRYSW